MFLVVLISVIANIYASVYFVSQGLKNKLQMSKILKILIYNLTQFLFCIMLLRGCQDMSGLLVKVCCFICILLQVICIIPLKNVLDGVVDKLNIEEEYEFLLKKEEMDKKYFALMKEYEEHVARIRHDFINQVAVAGSMVEEKDGNALGLKLLDELREEVESTRTAVYCSNKMVNIVVDVMHRQYMEKNIKLDVSIMLPHILYLDEMKICSIIQTILNEMLSIVELMDATEQSVKFQIKKAGEKLLFMVKCKNNGVREKRKYKKITALHEKYFERIMKDYKSGIYSRKHEDFIEIILSVSE